MKQIKRSDLTRREKEIYDYILSFKLVNGYAPTISEIAKNLYTSRSFVHEVIERLEEYQLLKYHPRKPRTIVIQKII